MTEGPLQLQAIAARATLAASGSETLLPVLAKILPQGRRTARMPIHLVLLIERTAATDAEDRVGWIPRALQPIVEGLGPDDSVALVVYGDRPKVVLPSEAFDRARLGRVVAFLESHRQGPRVELAEALKVAHDELQKRFRPGASNWIWTFAASPTAQEAACEQLGRTLAEHGVRLAFFGLGQDWSSALLTRLADAGRGAIAYAPRAADLQAAVARQWHTLTRTPFFDLRLRWRLSKGIALRRVIQCQPALAQWLPEMPTERDALVRVGDLPDDRSALVLFELIVPGRADGQLRLAELDLSYQLAVPTPTALHTGPQEIVVGIGETASPAHREVMRAVDLWGVNGQVQRAIEARRAGEVDKAIQLLANAERLANDLGLAELVRAIAQAHGSLAGGRTLPEAMSLALRFAARTPLQEA